MAHAFFLGVDVVPTDEDRSHAVTYALFEKTTEENDGVTFRLDHMRHHSDVDSADALAGHLQGLVADQPYIGRTSIIVNRTADFGQALLDALEERGLDPVAASLTEGTGVAAGETDEIGVHLGGVDAARTLADLSRDQRLVIDSHTTETASRLARDVQVLAEQLDEADGNLEALDVSSPGPSYDPEATHINSAALAVWLGTERSFDPSQHLKESPRTESPSGGGP